MHNLEVKGTFTLIDNNNFFNDLQDWYNPIYKEVNPVSEIKSNMFVYCIKYKWQMYLPNFIKRKFLKTIKLSGCTLQSVIFSDSVETDLTNIEVIFDFENKFENKEE